MPKKPEIAGQIVNRNEMAGILGCSPGTLDRHVAAGCPIIQRGTTKTGHKFNSADVIRWVKVRKSSADIGQSDPARRRYMLAAAELKELQLAEKRGALLPAAEVEAQWVDTCARLRSRMMIIPGRAAARCASNPDDQVAIENVIEEEIRGALSELSGG